MILFYTQRYCVQRRQSQDGYSYTWKKLQYNFAMKTFLILMKILCVVVSLHSNLQTVAIICTTDIHGGAFPYQTFRADTGEKYLYGGLEFMAQMVETVMEEHKGNVLYLDAGDQFQGAVESSSLVSSGQTMNQYFNEIKGQIQVSALGNHEFDFGPETLENYMKNRKQPGVFLSANLRSEKGEIDFLPNQISSKVFKLTSGIMIGVIGLTTLQTLYQMEAKFPDYQLLPYAPIVEAQSKSLRKAGAHAVVIAAHLGDSCNTKVDFGVWREGTLQKDSCSGEMTKLLKAFPKGTVDAVAQGHTHVFAHHFIDGIPVVGTSNGGYYFNVIYLKFQNRQIYDRVIEGPIPVCQKVFKNIGRCNYIPEDQLEKAGRLVEWKFHGRKVASHKQLKEKYDKKWRPMMQPYLQFIAHSQVYLEVDYFQQCELTNLIISLVVQLIEVKGQKIDFAFFNPSFFRSIWLPGNIQERHFLTMFPYLDNLLLSFDITGQELIDTLQIIQAGQFYNPTYGLVETISITSNGEKRYHSATFLNGEAIDPQKTYHGLSRAHLIANPRHIFHNASNKYTLRNVKQEGEFNMLAREGLKKLGNILREGLIDPQKPHLIVISI